MRIAIGVLILLILMLQAELWFGHNGRRDLMQLRAKLTAQEQFLAELRARNESLAAEVSDLKQGLSAIEGVARTELGMVKRDEVFVQVFEVPSEPSAANPPNPTGEAAASRSETESARGADTDAP